MDTFYKPESRDDKIANDRFIINVIKIVKQIMTTLVTTYFIGLLWYRFSDNWQKYLGYTEGDDKKFFVVVFGLRPPEYAVEEDSPWALGYNETMASDLDRRLFEGENWDMPNDQNSRLTEIDGRLITCMYYALTTLSTVGYGDYYPSSIAEKIVGSII